jgi:hypothetical protein
MGESFLAGAFALAISDAEPRAANITLVAEPEREAPRSISPPASLASGEGCGIPRTDVGAARPDRILTYHARFRRRCGPESCGSRRRPGWAWIEAESCCHKSGR